MEDLHSYFRNRAAFLEIKLRGPQAFVLWVTLILVIGLWVMDLSERMGLCG